MGIFDDYLKLFFLFHKAIWWKWKIEKSIWTFKRVDRDIILNKCINDGDLSSINKKYNK